MEGLQIAAPLVLMCLAAWPAQSSGGDGDGSPKVRASLVADVAEARAGAPFHLGVRFEIDDGWHIYWRYPGGAGLATAVDFELPEGVVAGPLQWPVPITFTQSGDIPGYGYVGSVVLASEVSAAATFDRSRPSTVRVVASWLACKEVCVLGSAELEGSLLALPEDPAFREWEKLLPRASEAEEPPFTFTADGGLESGRVTQWLRWRETPRSVEWFPDPPEAIEVGDIRVQTRGGLTRIDAALRRRKGVGGPADDLPSLVVVTGADGVRTGWKLNVHLENQPS
jgi:DsbC/DsbD-like thiol-disulfide interchange protein